MTFTDLQTSFLQSAGSAGSSDTTLLDFFTRTLARRYQMAFSELNTYQTQQTRTASTVVGQQFYHYPVGVQNIETVTITINSVPYPVIVINSQLQWDYINRLQIVPTAIPWFLFPRRDDFGIYPTPQGVYTITFNYHIRDRSLTVADYTTGTVSVVNNSQTVTGASNTFTAAMIGRWFVMNDPTKQGQGYFYRITDVPTSSTLTLETSYEGVSVSGAMYRIGECPELPPEIHLTLVDGVLADYYAGPRNNLQSATWFNNVFWTGDGQQTAREGAIFTGGILGAKQRYAGRSDGAIVYRNGTLPNANNRALMESII